MEHSPDMAIPTADTTTDTDLHITTYLDRQRSFTTSSHKELLDWQNIILKRYTEAENKPKSLMHIAWSDRTKDNSILPLPLDLSHVPDNLSSTMCHIYFDNQLSVVLTLFFVRSKRKAGTGTLMIQGKNRSEWTQTELLTLLSIIKKLTMGLQIRPKWRQRRSALF